MKKIDNYSIQSVDEDIDAVVYSVQSVQPVILKNKIMILIFVGNTLYLVPILIAMYVGAFIIMGTWGAVTSKFINGSLLS